jgi:non-homologous end joining protein Ku
MPRPIWSGTISIGLVSVPVKMYSATESKELRFHFLHKDDLEPIGYDKVRKDTGEHVDPDEIVRGFEVEQGPLRRADGGGPGPSRHRAHALDRHLRLRGHRRDRPDLLPEGVRKELLALLKEKAETGEISAPREEEAEEGEVVDLMAALRESVERTKQQRKRTPKRSTTRKRKAS